MDKKRFTVTISQVSSVTRHFDCDSQEEAMRIAQEQFDNWELFYDTFDEFKTECKEVEPEQIG